MCWIGYKVKGQLPTSLVESSNKERKSRFSIQIYTCTVVPTPWRSKNRTKVRRPVSGRRPYPGRHERRNIGGSVK